MPIADRWSTTDPVPEEVDVSVRAFGNKVNNSILRFLHERPQANLGDILESLGFKESTTQKHLVELEELGVISGDIPMGRRRGRSVNYSLNADRIKQILEAHMAYLLTGDTSSTVDATPPTK